jgi:hypothetical protein
MIMVQGKDERRGGMFTGSTAAACTWARQVNCCTTARAALHTKHSAASTRNQQSQTMPAQQDSTHTMHIKQGGKGCTLHSTHKALTRAPEHALLKTPTRLPHQTTRGARAQHCSHKGPSLNPEPQTLTALLLLLTPLQGPSWHANTVSLAWKLPPCFCSGVAGLLSAAAAF